MKFSAIFASLFVAGVVSQAPPDLITVITEDYQYFLANVANWNLWTGVVLGLQQNPLNV